MRARKSILLVLCGLIFTGMGCELPYGDSEPPEEIPPQTEILRIDVDPNPVALGDTTRVTVVIRDSLDTRFRYTWHPGPWFRVVGAPLGQPPVTDTNRVLLAVITEITGIHRIGVSVDNGTFPEGQSVSKSFEIEVVESKTAPQ